jgi:predicted amidohydrolase YtcJ
MGRGSFEGRAFSFFVALFVNGRIFTASRVFRRGSLLVRGERIAAVLGDGADTVPAAADIRATIDLAGAYVLPGFVDTHIHLSTLALKAERCDLSGARSAAEVCELLAAWRRERDLPTIMGVDWDESHWVHPTPVTKAMLDAIDAHRPVLARRMCGHVGVANTSLLSRLTQSPGFIDASSGLVREHALWEAGRLCGPGPTALRDGLEGAIRSLHALGITAVHDIVDPGKFDAYAEGISKSRAPLRIDVLLHAHPREIERHREKVRDADPRFLRVAGVKCFLDGSLGGFTAALHEPYAGSAERGTLLMETAALASIVEGAHAGGHSCAMHAIGDRAIDQALDVLDRLPHAAEHVRIEHCEVVGPKQLERLQARPVLLALQPNFVRGWGMPGGLYEQRLGADRLRSCNPFRTFQNAGIRFVFGSDGMPPGPLHGLVGAIDHPVNGERMDRAEAIARYTEIPNHVRFHAREAGALEPGRLADFVILDGNPLEADLDRIRVVRTVIGGRVVFGPE